MAAIRVEALTLGYAGGAPALRDLGGSFAPGCATAVVGPNGAGKSTLLKALAGLLRPRGGRVVTGLAPGGVAYLPQQADLDRSFPISVEDVVGLGLYRRAGPFAGLRHAGRQRVATALEQVGLGGLGRRPIGSLSSGQLQRALFARLIVQDAAAILLDEPFAAVDLRTTAALLGLIRRWHAEEGRTVVAVLHDLAQVREHCAQTLLLAGRAVAWGATAQVLTPANLLRAWGLPELAAAATPTGEAAGTPPPLVGASA